MGREIAIHCYRKGAILGLGLIALPLIFIHLVLGPLAVYKTYSSMNDEVKFSPLCRQGGDFDLYMLADVPMTPEAEQLLHQWPDRLWPISHYFRPEGNRFVTTRFIFRKYQDRIESRTTDDFRQLRNLAGLQNDNFPSDQCSDYALLATEAGIKSGIDMEHALQFKPPLGELVETLPLPYLDLLFPSWPDKLAMYLFQPKDFDAKLLIDHIDPFTGLAIHQPAKGQSDR